MSDKDFEKQIKAQLTRLEHLLGFPEAPMAIRDYLAALWIAGTIERVALIIDDIVQSGGDRCPLASTLRKMAYDRKEAAETRRVLCPECDGTGYVTIWQLITYHGNSFGVKRKETLPAIRSQGHADEFQRRIIATPGTENQIVLSAARRCVCLAPIEHH